MVELKSRTQLDAVAIHLFQRLTSAGFLEGEFQPDAFHTWKLQMKERFVSRGTTITPVMERALFGLAAVHQPKLTVALGSFEGYALAWLTGPLAGAAGARFIGYDVDGAVCETARRNFQSLGLEEQVTIMQKDAFQGPGEPSQGPVDLLYIDIEAQGSKAGYTPLLEAWYPLLRPGALVIAHDISVEKFTAELAPYSQLVRDRSRFQATVSLRIDPCGLEVTRV